jgi:hypothetical protein
VYYDPGYGDSYGSNRLPPSHSSPVIGDSGKSSSANEFSITDSTKSWTENKWQNWGLRIGALTFSGGADLSRYNYIRRITSNTEIKLSATPVISGFNESSTVYSIEYYAGRGDKSATPGTTITDTYKDFSLYLPSLIGYVVVISDNIGSKVAKGTVIWNDATSFTVDAWTVLYGSVPGETNVGYYFSATGHAMMCSDCHSNDTINSTAAQGPHGSAVKWMLKGRNRAWPTLSASENGTGTGTLRVIGQDSTHRSISDGTSNGLFCLNCHSTTSFTKDVNGRESQATVHAIHSWALGPACIRCHIIVPHGGKLSRLIGDGDSTMPSRYAFNNDTANTWVTSYGKVFDYPGNTGRTGDPAGYYNPSRSHYDGNYYCSVTTDCGHHPTDGACSGTCESW